MSPIIKVHCKVVEKKMLSLFLIDILIVGYTSTYSTNLTIISEWKSITSLRPSPKLELVQIPTTPLSFDFKITSLDATYKLIPLQPIAS